MRILGISGSLRAKSVNTGLLHAAAGLLPEDVQLSLHDYSQVPLYNEDVDMDAKPAQVAQLKEAIAGSDAVLFATPEYNHSIPGVLKNALDWVSRPAFNSVLVGKPAGIISASKSFVGGARAQVHLRQVLDSTLAPVFPHPDVLVGLAFEKSSPDGVVNDPVTLKFIHDYLRKFVAWINAQLNGKK